MNSIWLWFLYRLNGWTARRIRHELAERKVRWFKRELRRQIAHWN